jgi:hypothetical protein
MSQLNLCLELPTSVLSEFMQYEDLGFCIARYVLDDPFYRQHYAVRPGHVIMDNGAYEQGHPLDTFELFEAINLLNRDSSLTVIAPDVLTHHEETFKGSVKFLKEVRRYHPLLKVGGVVQGQDFDEQVYSYNEIVKAGFDLICISFAYDRPNFLRNYPLRPDIAHHLFGSYGLDEINWLRHHINLPNGTSIDTSKPIKAALNYQYLWEYKSNGKWDPNATFTPLTLKYARFNTMLLRSACKDDTTHFPSPEYYYQRPLKNRSDSRVI